MASSTARRYPAGTGWALGFAVGLLVGLVGWVATGRVVFLIVLTVATGTALGVAAEGALDTVPPTARQRRVLGALATLGALAGLAVLLWVVFAA